MKKGLDKSEKEIKAEGVRRFLRTAETVVKKLEIENHADLLRFAIITLDNLRSLTDDASADVDDTGRA